MTHKPHVTRDQAKRLIVQWMLAGHTWKPRDVIYDDEGSSEGPPETTPNGVVEGG
jgi:hypothetical protein